MGVTIQPTIVGTGFACLFLPSRQYYPQAALTLTGIAQSQPQEQVCVFPVSSGPSWSLLRTLSHGGRAFRGDPETRAGPSSARRSHKQAPQALSHSRVPDSTLGDSHCEHCDVSIFWKHEG